MMDSVALVFLLASASLVDCTNKFENIPDYELTLEERIVKHGYPVEVHQIITEDGYILAAYRIPHGFNNSEPNNKNKSAVLIVHGMGGTPHNFFIMGTKRASPYYFADQGMDVWVFSSRGIATPFKKQHVKLDWNKDSAFWMHSFHELAVYDLAATIDYILKLTGQEKVSMIGHSAGGNMFYALLSEKPEYNQKVKLLISWGSAPIIRRMDYPIVLLAIYMGDLLKAMIKSFRMIELAPTVTAALKPLMIQLCLNRDPLWYTFFTYFSYIIGSHKSVMDRFEYYPIAISHMPRVSSWQPFHFIDNVKNGTFRKYNYGPKGNLKHYGQTDPPHYNLSAVTAPGAFFNAQQDGFITLQDVHESIANLPNTVFLYIIPYRKFNHVDYIFGYNATEMIFEPTYRMIKQIDDGNIPPPVKLPSDYEYNK